MMKRQRVSRACDTCRIKKDRCDGAKPSCSTCSSLQRTCSYNAVGKKRGVPTGYLRTLELLLGLVLRQIHGSEDVLCALLKSVNIPSQLGQISKDGEGSNNFLAAWKNSSVLKEIERVLSFSDQAETEGERNLWIQTTASDASPEGYNQLTPESWHWHLPQGISHVQENFSENNTSLPTENTQGAYRNANPSGLTPARQTQDCGTQTYTPRTTQTHATKGHDFMDSDEPRELRLPENARQLFDIYFTYTNSFFPIIEKHEILRTAFSYGTKAVRISPFEKGSGDHAALWAILTLASFQHSPKSSGFKQREQPNPDILYRTARWLIPYEDGLYEPGHAQALLVLSLVKLGQQKWWTASILIGFAIRIVTGLGLSRPASSGYNATPSLVTSTHRRSKNIFLACFVLDTLIATEMGCSPLLRKEDAARVGPLEEDGLEEWHPWEDQTGLAPNPSVHDFFGRGPVHGLSTFNRLVSLTCILNDFRCCASRADSDFADFERQMRHWESSLETNYRINLDGMNNFSAPTAPHILGLHLAFEGVLARITLDRRKHHEKTSPTAASRIQVAGNLKRLERLLKAYMDNYGASATSPTFLVFLPVPCRIPCDDIDPSFTHDLSNALHSMAAELSLVWKTQKYAASSQRGEVGVPNTQPPYPPQTTAMYGDLAATQRSQGELSQQAERMSVDGGSALTRNLPIQPVSSIPWPGLDPSSLSCQGPGPPPIRMTTTSNAPSQDAEQMQHSIPLPTNLQPPVRAPDRQNQQASNDSNLDTTAFTSMDDYGMSRSTRIAPDLDALLDELDYLEGSDR